MPEIAFVMGKSASGKDSIYKRLISDNKLNLNTVILYTTRPKREGEVQGIEYNFVTDKQALEMENNNKIIEIRCYNTVYGVWKYFTADDGQIDINSGKKYIVIGTLEAYEQFCKYFGSEHILPIYIEVDDGIRLKRALDREKLQKTPQYEEMCRRFLADTKDFSEENLKKANINKRYNNDKDIDSCLQIIAKDILEIMV